MSGATTGMRTVLSDSNLSELPPRARFAKLTLQPSPSQPSQHFPNLFLPSHVASPSVTMYDEYLGRDISRLRTQTRTMEAGYQSQWSEGSVVPPIYRTSTFRFENAKAGKRAFQIAYGLAAAEPQEHPVLIYSRVNNPNVEIVQDKIRATCSSEAALLTSSGMAAVSCMLMALTRPGDSVVFTDPVYGGTEFFFRHLLPQHGVKSSHVPAGASEADMLAALEAVRDTVTCLYIETPANPTITLTSLRAARRAVDKFNRRTTELAAAAAPTSSSDDSSPAVPAAEPGTERGGRHPVVIVCDDTFLGPVFSDPLRNGADVVIYSLTKFFGGHSDLIAGAILGKRELIREATVYRTIFGSVTDADTAWLLCRSLPTLRLRMTAQMENAHRLIPLLQGHPAVATVLYPGLPRNPPEPEQEKIFKEEYSGGGSIITFCIKGGEAEAFTFLDSLHVIKLAVSLGGIESLIQHPASMTHSDMTAEEQMAAGITPAMIRLSVGIEDFRDLEVDIRTGLDLIVGGN